MQPGRNYLLKCPKCSKMFYTESVRSMNNFGSTLYSDGKQVGSMMREFPSIIKCNNCSKFFWRQKAEIVEKDYEEDTIKQYWKAAEPIEFLNMEELFESLKSDAISSDNNSAFIRQRIWWIYNDRVREGKELFIDEADENNWRKNLLRLKDFSDTAKDTQKLLVAEMNRNLGNFNECLELLNSIKDDSLNWIVEKFRELCNKKETLVFVLR